MENQNNMNDLEKIPLNNESNEENKLEQGEVISENQNQNQKTEESEKQMLNEESQQTEPQENKKEETTEVVSAPIQEKEEIKDDSILVGNGEEISEPKEKIPEEEKKEENSETKIQNKELTEEKEDKENKLNSEAIEKEVHKEESKEETSFSTKETEKIDSKEAEIQNNTTQEKEESKNQTETSFIVPLENMTEKDIRNFFKETSMMNALEICLQELNEKRPSSPVKWLGICFVRYYVNNVMQEGKEREEVIKQYKGLFDEIKKLETETNENLKSEQPSVYLEQTVVPKLMDVLFELLNEKRKDAVKYVGEELLRLGDEN